jgi:hypothetical protein
MYCYVLVLTSSQCQQQGLRNHIQSQAYSLVAGALCRLGLVVHHVCLLAYGGQLTALLELPLLAV